MVDDEGDGGRKMGEHVCDLCPTCANEGDLEMEYRVKKEVSPSATDLYKPVPPSFAVPFPPSQDIRILADLAFVQYHRPTEREYDKNRIVVEEMGECTV